MRKAFINDLTEFAKFVIGQSETSLRCPWHWLFELTQFKSTDKKTALFQANIKPIKERKKQTNKYRKDREKERTKNIQTKKQKKEKENEERGTIL